MKKLLVSDYDGTIHIDDLTTKNNIKAINKFMINNTFAVATGRSFEDFLIALKKTNIKCNYYILNYGALILDQKFNIIYEDYLNNKEIHEIYNYFKDKECTIYYCNYKYNSKEYEGKIYKIILVYNDKEKQMNDYYDFIKKYKYNIFVLNNHCHLEIVSSKVDKSKAIDYIKKISNIDKVYVIGDGDNDITMIKRYNGYCVDSAKKNVKEVAKKTYKSVSSLIEEIMEDKA